MFCESLSFRQRNGRSTKLTLRGFLNKPLQALTRCLELSPDRPEARSYYLRVCAELRIQPAFFGFGTGINVLQVKGGDYDFELRIHGQYSLVFMVACEAIVHTTRWVSSEEHFEKGSVVGAFLPHLGAVVRVVIDLETVGDGWVTLRFKGTMPGKPIDLGNGAKKAKEVIKSLKQFVAAGSFDAMGLTTPQSLYQLSGRRLKYGK